MEGTSVGGQAPTSPNLFHARLRNGLQVVAQCETDVQSVAVGLFVQVGARDEHHADLAGASHFLEHMMFRDNTFRTGAQTAANLARMGVEYNANTWLEQTAFHFLLLKEHLSEVLHVLHDLMEPALHEDDVQIERDIILQEIARAHDQPLTLAYRHLMETFFANHPLGRDPLGHVESVRAMTSTRLREHWQRYYRADNMVLAVCGNVAREELIALSDKWCSDWPTGMRPDGYQDARLGTHPHARAESLFAHDHPTQLDIITTPLQQELLLLASPAVDTHDPDLYAAEVIAQVLGDEFGSRLFWGLRETGIAETAVASLASFDGAGMLTTYVSTSPDDAQHALDTLQTILASFQREGPDEGEMQRAKTKLASRAAFDGELPFDRMQDLAHTWLAEGHLHSIEEEIARIEAVTFDDVRRVLDRFPLTRQRAVVAYGPLQENALVTRAR